MKLKVECYAGYKAAQHPARFTLQGRSFQVEEVLDRWYGPDQAYFKVRADDANIYILKHSPEDDEWSLEMFRSTKA